MKKRFIATFICLITSSLAFLPERGQSISLTTSIIIPCAAQHFSHLKPLLEQLARQTILPEEVVVSLSQTEKLENTAINAIEYGNWPFALKLLRHKEKKSAGMNRNLACAIAAGPLIICQDADDIPHPARVEIIRFFFEHYPISHLMHTYFYDRGNAVFIPYQKEQICFASYQRYEDLELVYQDRLHNGNIAFLHPVSQRIKWDDVFECDHDVKFNRDVYRLFSGGCAAISCDLILYRQQLSAFNPANTFWENEP